MTCSTLTKSFEYFNILGSFGVEHPACGTFVYHGCFRGSFSEGELGRHIQFTDHTRLSFSEGKIRSLWAHQVAPTEGLTVTLEAVGKAKASKGQCPDSKLLRI